MKILFFSLSILILLALSSCKKYEDGPVFSLASKKSRLVNVWKLDKVIHNGVEQALTADDKDDKYEFTKDGKYKVTVINGSFSYTIEGTWEFDNNKEHIITSFTYNNITYTDTTKILRLKSKELWTEDRSGNDIFEYHYVPY